MILDALEVAFGLRSGVRGGLEWGVWVWGAGCWWAVGLMDRVGFGV